MQVVSKYTTILLGIEEVISISTDTIVIQNLFKEALDNEWKICVYGLGKLFLESSEAIFRLLEINPDFYCDRDNNRLNYLCVEDKRIMTLDRLLVYPNPVLVFLFIGSKYIDECYNLLSENPSVRLIRYMDITKLFDRDSLIKKYFQLDSVPDSFCQSNHSLIETKRTYVDEHSVAIYTCITGQYDMLQKRRIWDDAVDYYLVSDDKSIEEKANLYGYTYIDAFKVCPDEITSPKEINRYCKLHGPYLFSDYEYCIYIDGNISVVSDITALLGQTNRHGIAVHKNPFFDDVYVELICLSVWSRVEYKDLQITARIMSEENYPRHFGLPECGVIIFNNGMKETTLISQEWYKNYKRFPARRDQGALAYTLWKLGISINEVLTLDGNIRGDRCFVMNSHSVNTQT